MEIESYPMVQGICSDLVSDPIPPYLENANNKVGSKTEAKSAFQMP